MPKHEYGIAGYGLQREVLRQTVRWVVPVLVVSLGLIALALRGMPAWLALLMMVLAPATPLALKHLDRRVARAVDPLLTGREGECEVATVLRDSLGDDYYLIHDVDFGHGNVDHVVVAPSGIYTVEVKADLGRAIAEGDGLRVNNFDRESDLRQAYAEAMAVRDYLRQASGGRDHWVTPLLVFTRANVTANGQCRGVYVMHIRRLAHFVSYTGDKHDAKQRSAIAAALGVRTAERAQDARSS